MNIKNRSGRQGLIKIKLEGEMEKCCVCYKLGKWKDYLLITFNTQDFHTGECEICLCGKCKRFIKRKLPIMVIGGSNIKNIGRIKKRVRRVGR